jgi:cytochrome P450
MKGRALQRARIFLGEGLLTSEGDLHRRQRRLVLPAFHRERIQHYGEVMVDYGRRAAERWRDGEELDVAHEMTRLTLSIVGKTLFDADVAEEADELGRALTVLMDLFTTLLSPFAGILQRLPLPQTRRFRKAMARLDATIYRIIEERRAAGVDRGDLLSMLLLAQDEEGDSGGMSDLQVRDEAMTLFLAGHETTANALSWTWYLLSRNPEAERIMHDEIDRVCGDRLPSPADVPRLTFIEMVLAESMRIFPPAYLIGRMALEDVTVGEWRVPKGAIVIVAEIVTHRDARWFPDPMRFDPMRFTAEAKAARPKFAYFPFGGGPRICIGESFAWTEGILLLATIARKWRFTAGRDVEPLPLITLRPRGGMPMRAVARS